MAKVGAITALTDKFFHKMLTSVKNKLKRYARKENFATDLQSCLEIFGTLWILFENIRNYSTRKKSHAFHPKKLAK